MLTKGLNRCNPINYLMQKTLRTLLTVTASLGLASCASVPPYYLPRFQQISSTAQSCTEVDEKLTYHNVTINDNLSYRLKQRIRPPIVIEGSIPTTDYYRRRLADEFEQGRKDDDLRKLSESAFTIGEKHGIQYTNRQEKIDDLVDSLRITIPSGIRKDTIVLYIPPDVYARNVVQYVKDGRLSGRFSIHGELSCLTNDMYREISRRLKLIEDYEELIEKTPFNDLLHNDVGFLVNVHVPQDAPKPNLLLYLKVTDIERTGN